MIFAKSAANTKNRMFFRDGALFMADTVRVGIPVWITDVQSLRTDGDWYTLRQHWYREPLYNSKGEYTREYSRRLEAEFMEMLKAFEVQMY